MIWKTAIKISVIIIFRGYGHIIETKPSKLVFCSKLCQKQIFRPVYVSANIGKLLYRWCHFHGRTNESSCMLSRPLSNFLRKKYSSQHLWFIRCISSHHIVLKYSLSNSPSSSRRLNYNKITIKMSCWPYNPGSSVIMVSTTCHTMST